MKNLSTRSIAAVILLSSAHCASAVVIDFNTLPTSQASSTEILMPYSVGGYMLSTMNGDRLDTFPEGWQHNRGSSNGTTYASIWHDFVTQTTLKIARADSSAFSMGSIDLAELFNNGDYASYFSAQKLTFTGTLSGASMVIQSFTFDGLSDGAGGIGDFQTIVFGANWGNITEFTLTAYNSQRGDSGWGVYYALDNIVLNDVAAVPAPPSAWLLGSALLGLTGRRYKINSYPKT